MPDPGLDVVPGHQVTDPALALLGLGDVGRQVVGQVRHAVDQRVAEGERQAGEEQQGQQRDDGYRDPPAPDPSRQDNDERVEQQCHEAGDHEQQDDAA